MIRSAPGPHDSYRPGWRAWSGCRRSPPGTSCTGETPAARLGLPPATRRVGWLRGRRPRAGRRTKYGFARPATGETSAAILPRVNVDRIADALAAFAAHADPDGREVLAPVVDGPGWHRAERLPAPADVRLHLLPPRTPELQPVEPFGASAREAVANETDDRLADLGAIGFHCAVRLER